MNTVAAKLMFWPTLAWTILLARGLRNCTGWNWWDRIDDGLWLGALPLTSDVPKLHALGIRGVINLCAETSGPVAAHVQYGLEQLHLPTSDFTSPTRQAIDQAIAFIEQWRAEQAGVYLHCKAGRGRSATVAACWLMHSRGCTAEAAQAALTACRRQVARDLAQRDVVRKFALTIGKRG